MPPGALLALAIATEVAATLSLRASDGFTKLGPSIFVVVGYVASFALLAVVLKHIEGWTYEELSAALRVPRGTVMSRLYATRQRLLNILSGEPS